MQELNRLQKMNYIIKEVLTLVLSVNIYYCKTVMNRIDEPTETITISNGVFIKKT